MPVAPGGRPKPVGGPVAAEETRHEDEGEAVRVVVLVDNSVDNSVVVLVDKNEEEETEEEDGTKMVDTVVSVGTQLPGVRVAQFGWLNGSEQGVVTLEDAESVLVVLDGVQAGSDDDELLDVTMELDAVVGL